MWYLNIEDTVLSCDTTDEVIYYLMGYGDPHYKAPVLLKEANRAANHGLITGYCPNVDGPCLICIGEFMADIEFWYLQ